VVLATIRVRETGAQCRGFGGAQIRTVTLLTVVIGNLCLILTSRSGNDGENGGSGLPWGSLTPRILPEKWIFQAVFL